MLRSLLIPDVMGEQFKGEQSKLSSRSLGDRYSFFFLYFFSTRVSCIFARPRNLYVTKDSLEFLIYLPPSAKFWNYRRVPLHLVHAALGISPEALCMLGKYSVN